ncbi:MAG: hypothetical protein H6747_06620 [Deltaproteobacteria bacterium]|nr:hypothetical protein [Deltaproteobacteria bacterium]
MASVGVLPIGPDLRTSLQHDVEPPEPEEFAFVADDHIYLRQIDSATADALALGPRRWSATVLRGVVTEDRVHAILATRPLRSDGLKPRWRAYAEKRLLLGRRGTALCHGQAVDFQLVQRGEVAATAMDPPLQDDGRFDHTALERQYGKRLPTWIAARFITLTDNDCAAATWARDATLPAPLALRQQQLRCDDQAVVELWPAIARSMWATTWLYEDDDAIGRDGDRPRRDRHRGTIDWRATCEEMSRNSTAIKPPAAHRSSSKLERKVGTQLHRHWKRSALELRSISTTTA